MTSTKNTSSHINEQAAEKCFMNTTEPSPAPPRDKKKII